NLLAEGERSCQIRLEECSGLSCVSNTCAAGRDDGGQGKYTPQVGFILRKLSYSVIANNTLYIVMEYIDGITLREKVKREGGKIAPEPLLKMLAPIFKTLEQIHQQGIIHRDVSPDNIMLRNSNGRAVLLDFGAAHPYEEGMESEHSTSLRPGYAPVEQYSGKSRQDARTDEYALCATMYFAITGQKPSAAMERAFGDSELPPPSTLNVAMPAAFEAVLMKGLSVKAEDRYPSIEALENAFHTALQNTDSQLLNGDITDPKIPTPTPPVAPAPKKRNPKVLIGVLAAVACLFAGTALYALLGPHRADSLPSGAPTVIAVSKTAAPAVQSESPTSAPTVTAASETAAASVQTESPAPTQTTANPASIATTPLPLAQLTKYAGECRQIDDATVYVSQDGWLFDLDGSIDAQGQSQASLLGLTKSDSHKDISILTIPETVDGYPVDAVDFYFSENCYAPENVRVLMLSENLRVYVFNSFQMFDHLETVSGGSNLAFCHFYAAFSPKSPYYLSSINQNVVLGQGVLVHGAIEEGASSRAANVEEGVVSIAPNAFNSIDRDGNEQKSAFDTVNLPASLKALRTASLEGFNGKTLRFPDGVDVEYRLFGITAPENLTEIQVGKGVTFDYSSSEHYQSSPNRASFEYYTFTGTLYLEDGETLPTLYGLFAEDSHFTLDCLSGAVPADQIPDSVTVSYRDVATPAPTATPTAKPTASDAETVYGTVMDEQSYYNGETIYRSGDGWLYLRVDRISVTGFDIYLWGIAADNTLDFTSNTLTIPDRIQGTTVYAICGEFSSNMERKDALKVHKLVLPISLTDCGIFSFIKMPNLDSIEGGNLDVMYSEAVLQINTLHANKRKYGVR
ncbi:MAG TPA: serine/threonine-protein kinase, partial [Candidatus Limiplasma sp.]|nr:serine/threonine-protein kinase [Candidatus Limiplasma sp.]